MDLKCPNKLHGVLLEPAPGGVVELRCKSAFCGSGTGVIVLHRFSTESGELIGTVRFRDTPVVGRSKTHAST